MLKHTHIQTDRHILYIFFPSTFPILDVHFVVVVVVMATGSSTHAHVSRHSKHSNSTHSTLLICGCELYLVEQGSYN